MKWLVSFLGLSLLSCTDGRSATLHHHPDLRLAALAADSEGSHELFSNYRSDGPVKWNQSWPWKLDLSGVAWDQPNNATVITPRHVVMAAHYTRPVGKPTIFHDRSGMPHTRRIQQVVKLRDRGMRCDVAVGLLDEPLPDSIRRYPLPAVREDGGEALIGATVLVTEQNRCLYFHRVAHMGGNILRMRFDENFSMARRKSLIKGDSGNPAFILSKGALVLVETHTSGGAGAGPYYGSSAIQEKIREVVRELDPEFTFRTIELDTTTLADAEAGRKALPPPPRPSPLPTVVRPGSQGDPATRPPAPGQEPRRPRQRVVVPAPL